MTTPVKLYRRSVRDIVPYDHDLEPADLAEIMLYGMSPFIRWSTDVFTTWLYQAIKAYLEDRAIPVAERLTRKDAIGKLLNGGDYNAKDHAIAMGNVSLIRNVYVPLLYFEHEEQPAQVLMAVQKTGNLEMLRVVNTALIQAKNTPS